MATKNYRATFKAAKDSDGKPTGEVTAVVSVFGNVDVVGDRVVKGAFTDTLAQWKDSGDPIPMLWSHDWSNPLSHIGGWDASKAVETDEGLELTGKVDINEGNPIADQAYKLMSKRLVREFSFAYDVVAEQPAKDGANELLALDIIEAGPTLKGANSATRLVAAKAALEAEAKAGRTLSAKNEGALREAFGLIESVLASLPEGGKADDEHERKDEAAVAEAEAAEAEAQAAADAEAEAQAAAEAAEADDEKDDKAGPVDQSLIDALDDAGIFLTLGGND